MRPTRVCILHLLLALLVILVCAMSVQSRLSPRPARHYAGELPPGYAVIRYLEVCNLCGQFFGTQQSANCVHDKTFQTFAQCLSAVENR